MVTAWFYYKILSDPVTIAQKPRASIDVNRDDAGDEAAFDTGIKGVVFVVSWLFHQIALLTFGLAFGEMEGSSSSSRARTMLSFANLMMR